MTIFLAGHETTANTLAWTWYLLSQHPEVERKFHEELESVLHGADPTPDSLNDLKYTYCIVQEAMRLYPAAWSIGRIAIEDVEIGGHTFKKASPS
ncbi:cytochrome P450 [Effusibacillus dendaii]|nr:cytochrome P450 [Effusibacillus dendaii]